MGKGDRLGWHHWSPTEPWGQGGDSRTSATPAPPPPKLQLWAGKTLEQAKTGTAGPSGCPQPPQGVTHGDTPHRATPPPRAMGVTARGGMGSSSRSSKCQPPAPSPFPSPWPLVRVRRGDSDTYRHVTRATRVPPPTGPRRELHTSRARPLPPHERGHWGLGWLCRRDVAMWGWDPILLGFSCWPQKPIGVFGEVWRASR